MTIRDLGVIVEADVEFAPGLNVVTGETGAGKTMVVTALGLLLGGRADAGTVRSGAKQAGVDGRFHIAPESETAVRAQEAGAQLDDLGDGLAELLVTRTVAASGRGRAYAGGRSVPVVTLSEIADTLVSVHGQSEQVMLRSGSRQRDVLDAAGDAHLQRALTRYRAAWQRRREIVERLKELTEQAAARAAEAVVLRGVLERFEAVAPTPGEDAELKALTLRLENTGDLLRSTSTAHDLLAGDDVQQDASALPAVTTARRALEQAATLDDGLAGFDARLAEIQTLLADIAADLASYRAGVDVDPARLAAAHERRSALTDLVRLIPGGAADVDEAIAWAASASTRLLELDADTDEIDTLRAARTEAQTALDEASEALTAQRRKVAARLEKKVSTELTKLAMPHARLTVSVEPGEPGAHGADRIAFMLAPHAGAEPRPLGRGASGGELSRVMLALEVALAGSGGIVTFVFDEVDAGVGGKAAVEIGRRLAILARSSQVIVVTHLPQVAAFADRHLVVAKHDDGTVTSSGVSAVADRSRIKELARMLAGQEDSRSANEHAAELLALAEDHRRA